MKKVYLVGVGGSGMSALARYFVSSGAEVFGSDSGKNPEIEGVTFFSEHDSDNLPADLDTLVYSLAVPADNPERARARELGVSEFSYAEMLGGITQGKDLIAIAGTHGKTTTTGMTALVAEELGLDATVFVGSEVPQLGGNFRFGRSNWAVVEACEYGKSFLNLSPKYVIVPSLDYDHKDIYPTEQDYRDTFKKFFSDMPDDGIICVPEGLEINDLVEDFSGKVLRFSSVEFELGVVGSHNQSNAGGVLRLFEEVGFEVEKIKSGLRKFTGTARRFEKLGEKNGQIFYTDYAHHPVEINALVKSAEEKFPNQKILFIFQPHQYSRTREFFDDFVRVLRDKNVWVADVYEARDSEEDKRAVNSQMLAESAGAAYVSDVLAEIKNADAEVIFLLGAGDINRIYERI